jgi:predicted phage baseplate assembly protein
MTQNGNAPQMPIEIVNRAGLSAIAYRIGTHTEFKQAVLARLAAKLGLHTHDESDFTVALIDTFAVMADVLTFYQERIANESYLRTAIERRSTLELARLIDYRPRPGVAASTYLAFTLEDAPGAPEQGAQAIAIGTRLKVQSIPGPGEQPQVFETVEEIEARPDWNAMRPLKTQAQPISAAMESVILRGTSTDVKPGDSLLVVADDRDVKRVVKVAPDSVHGVTRADLSEDPPDPPPFRLRILPMGVFFARALPLRGFVVAERVLGHTWRQHDLHALARVHNWSLPHLKLNIRRQVAHRFFPPEQGVFAFRQRAAIFGHNAPKYLSLPLNQRTPNDQTVPYPSDWENRTLDLDSHGNREIDLDRVYQGIVPGSWVVLESQTARKIYRVEDVSELSRADFAISGKVTRLRLDSDDGFGTFTLRGTSVFLQSEKLELADLPIPEAVEGPSVTLDQTFFDLKIGQTVILTGARDDLEGVVDSEVLTIADITFSEGYTTLSFRRALQNSYVRDSVTINANVALATHGETVRDILGGGNASEPFQRLALRQPPLTYVSSNSPSGADSTLELRVNELLWHEVPSFFRRGPNERVFVTRTSDDGATTVEFGDGQAGARPPTGVENIVAVYRKGAGAAGNVEANRLSLLTARPPGVRGVTNPLSAKGATDSETRDDIRRNAALTMLTLDRIVSLQDYEDFARAFAGVAKASATWTWSGQTRGVFVTVAGAGGAELAEQDQTYINLLAAMRKAGDPHVSLRVQTYRKTYFRLAATVMVDPDARTEDVLAAVEQKLRTAFSFDARGFGQPAALSEVMAAIQSVAGVRAVDVDKFFRTDDPAADGISRILIAAAPEAGTEDQPLAAELLTLDPRPVELVGVNA